MSIRILQISDLHLTAEDGGLLKGVPTHAALRDVVEFISSQSLDFDHVVLTGDVTHHGDESAYRAAREILRDHCHSLYVLPGNHDDRASMRAAFADRLPRSGDRLDFSVRDGGWRLIGLDTLDAGQPSGHLSSQQLEWLSSQLSADINSPTVLFMHHPPVAVDCPWLDAIMLRDSERFLRIVTAAQQVRLVCTGHVHLESEQRLGHLNVVTSPSTCVQFDRSADGKPVLQQIPPGFRVLELHDGEYSTGVVRLPSLKYPSTNGT